VPLEAVSMPPADTATSPFNGPVASSRTTFHVGNAIRTAGAEIRRKALALAGDMLEIDPADLDLQDGQIVARGVGPRASLGELLGRYGFEGYSLVAEARYSSAGSSLLAADHGLEPVSTIFWMISTQAAEVEVDVETGVIRVVRIAAAADIGRAINPTGCEQQIEGGVVMGLSNALFEDLVLDERGRIANGTLADYKVATVHDVPEIIPIIVESDHAEAPFGAKGIGEPASAATPPAIANALFDAVGVRITDLPLTPAKVLAALEAARAGGDDGGRSGSA
jgi:carbon-monoxide dehydrogenase large subunit